MAVNRGRLKLLLIVLIFVAPFILADLAFRFWKPEKYTNYGELLEAVEFRPAGLYGPAGESFDFATLRGKWVFVLRTAEGCDRACEQALYLMRQVRLALGREQGRVERLVVAASSLPEGLMRQHPGLRQARYESVQALGGALAKADAAGRIHVVDPYGRFVMRFPEQADGTRMIKDVRRLLQYSRL